MADNLFFFVLMSMFFAQGAGFAKTQWGRIIGFSGTIIFTVLSMVAMFADRKL